MLIERKAVALILLEYEAIHPHYLFDNLRVSGKNKKGPG